MRLIPLLTAALLAFTTGTTAIPTLAQKPGTKIPNQYIVVYKNGADPAVIAQHESWLQTAAAGGSLQRRDGRAFPQIPKFAGFQYLRKYADGARGYAAKITGEIAEALMTLPEVKLVEQDSIVSITGVQTNPQAWGLRRISQPDLPLPADFTFPDSAGTDVDAYIIDTGVRISHPEFVGRAIIGASFSTDRNDVDGNGHGTHVAGT
ncbi:serine protease, partial [Dinochytrium kinnereticum]